VSDAEFFKILQLYLKEGFTQRVKAAITSDFMSSEFLRKADETSIEAAISQVDAALLGAPRTEEPAILFHGGTIASLGVSDLFPANASPPLTVHQKRYLSTTTSPAVTQFVEPAGRQSLFGPDQARLGIVQSTLGATNVSPISFGVGGVGFDTKIGCCVAKLHIPVGFPLLLLTSISDHPEEEEVLLPRNLDFTLRSTSVQRDLFVWEWDVSFPKRKEPSSSPAPVKKRRLRRN